MFDSMTTGFEVTLPALLDTTTSYVPLSAG
jgi:hypothetical protein